MAALVVTVTQVLPGSGNSKAPDRVAGSTITAGQVVYVSTTGVLEPAIATTAAAANALGIAMNGGAAGQPIDVVTGGEITLGAGAAPAVGMVYCVSAAAAGSIVPYADLVSTNLVTILGVGVTGNKLRVAVNVTGVLKA